MSSINRQHVLTSTFLPIREEAKMKEAVDSDHDTGLAKEDAELEDDVTLNHSPGYKAKPRI